MERVADYIIRKISQSGIKKIFLVTGRGILYLTDALARNVDIDGVSTYHEQGASYAAMASASIENRLSACLVSTGCASSNAVTACLCAYQDNLPVVFISGNNIKKETTNYTQSPIRTYGSQEADIVEIVSSITKYAVMISDANKVAYEVEKALYLSGNGRKGPVWIDVPLDVQNMRIEEEELEHYVVDNNIFFSDVNYVKIIKEELDSSERPLLLIGGGATEPDVREDIKKFVKITNIPVVFSPKAADVYGTEKELSIGAIGSIGGSRAGNFAIQNADYIIVLGSKLCSQTTGMKNAFAREARIVVIDIDSYEHTKEGVHIDRVINADIHVFLDEIMNMKLMKVSRKWVDKCLHWKSLFSIGNEDFIKDLRDRNMIDLYILSDELSNKLPEDATIITDAGFEELIIPSTVRFRERQRCIFPAAQGAMGYAIPAILGAHYAGRNNIVCIVGDGSFMMNMQELGIIKANNIPVKILVINNNMYSVIRKRQRDLFRNRTIGNDPSDGVPAPDFELIANSVGFLYNRIESLSELRADIGDLFVENDHPMIVEIISDIDQKYLHESYAVNEKRKLEHRPIEDMAPFIGREILKKEMIINLYN